MSRGPRSTASRRRSSEQANFAPTPSSGGAPGPTSSSPRLPTSPIGWRLGSDTGGRRHDRDRADPRSAGAIRQLPRPLLHGNGAGVLRRPAQPRPALCGPLCRKGSGGEGARPRRCPPLRLAGHRDCRPAEALGAAVGPSRPLGSKGGSGKHRPLDVALARAGERGLRGLRTGGLMLEPLYTAAEMKAAEEGHDVKELMQRAGEAVAELVLEVYPDAQAITVVCGPGNNGGDGRIAAGILAEARKTVRIVESKPEEEEKDLGEPDLVIDALFGTGFSGAPRPAAARLIEQINELDVEVVAIDIASGVDASTGEVAGAAVDAWHTIALHGEKVGSYVAPGAFLDGYSQSVDLGLEDQQTEHARVTSEILRLVPRRSLGDTKYTAGSVLVVGGSPGLTGAVCLTAEAAFRSDAGYVTVAAPAESLPVIETRLLEAVKRPLEDVWEAVQRAGALAIGPGLGRGRKELVHRLLETALPAVVDADGLRELRPFERDAPTVLTPHSGELGRLLGEEPSWVDAHRLEALRRAVEGFRCVVVLKGAGTLVGARGEAPLVAGGAAALATAGTGDVLTGIVAAFLAKGMEPRMAAAAAVRVHTDAASASG